MTRYNNNRFTPGRKGNLRQFMNKAYIIQYYKSFNINQTFDNINNGDDITEGTLCGCMPMYVDKRDYVLNDSFQTNSMRISQAINGTLGGRIMFGNFGKPITIDSLGGREGQPGGSPKPLRNKF